MIFFVSQKENYQKVEYFLFETGSPLVISTHNTTIVHFNSTPSPPHHHPLTSHRTRRPSHPRPPPLPLPCRCAHHSRLAARVHRRDAMPARDPLPAPRALLSTASARSIPARRARAAADARGPAAAARSEAATWRKKVVQAVFYASSSARGLRHGRFFFSAAASASAEIHRAR